MITRILMSLSLLAVVSHVWSQNQWQLTKDKNGIKVYTMEDANSKFKNIKVVAILQGTVQQLANVLMDAGNTKNWVYGTKNSYLVKKISPLEIIYYSETALPWPVSNRDVAIQMKVHPDLTNNTLKASAEDVVNVVPPKKGIVRLSYFNASWNVTSEEKNKINITYILKMNPGGSIPASVTNMFITKAPYETFSNLAELLTK